MDLSEFSPFPVSVDWEGQEITLKPFDLRSMTWAERFFCLDDEGGFDRMNEILKNKHGEAAFQNAVIEIIFYLSGSGFQKHGIFTAKELKEDIRTHENKLKIFIDFRDTLSEILKTSNPEKVAPEPELTGGAIFEFFKAQEEEKHQPKINWAQTYTKLYETGGMSIDEFYSLTIRQLFAIIEEITYLDGEDFKDNAMIHGIPANKIKIPRRREKQLIH